MFSIPPFASRFSHSSKKVKTIFYFTHLYLAIWIWLYFKFAILRPRGLTFAWWECSGLCHRHKPSELAHSFLFCYCVSFCLYGPISCISFHKFSRQVSAFSPCSSGLISALLVLSTVLFLMKVLLSPDVILCGRLGLKQQLTN